MNDGWHAHLERTLTQVWQRLGRGVADRHAAARYVTLATVGKAGPETRIVVLRACDRERANLEFHTDKASAKVSEITDTATVSLLVWDARAQFQIRMRGKATLEAGGAEAFAQLPETAQRVYGGTPPPGSKLARPEDHDPAPNPDRFMRILVSLENIETLHLGKDLHHRALFQRQDSWTGTWLTP
mgnify:CR=1 FL=1